jgi:hypothetical protein
MSIENLFVPYQIALDMKLLGFDELSLGWYNNDTLRIDVNANQTIKFHEHLGRFEGCVLAPTFSQSFKFFRNKHDLRASIMDFIDDETGIEWDYEIALIGTDLDEYGHYKALVSYSIDDESRKFKTYEKAELACLIKLIELVTEF